MAQDAAALRKERDKLVERGLLREAVDLYTWKLLSAADADAVPEAATTDGERWRFTLEQQARVESG